MKKHKTTHEENLARLARIEGQVRGLQRMIDEGKYCIDIITQIQAVRAALQSVSEKILHKHMDHCVADAFRGRSRKEASIKMDEVFDILKRMRK
ncbi:MAG: metal-sensitive transcriptional regulator [Kiritimatiellae bacterium]|nr:metal-sensitive transcriptional regulator [Kiritimatiellia bacterium]